MSGLSVTPRGVRRRMSLRAFTLIELMVVIGILTVLMSIILPAVSRAREHGRIVACLSNLRSIVQACHSYAADHKACMVPFQIYKDTEAPSPNPNPCYDCDEAWCNILVKEGYLLAPDATGKPPQTRSVFFCPSADVDMAVPNIDNVHTIPANRLDDQGAKALRYVSYSTKQSIDCWYGMNADLDATDLSKGCPNRRTGAHNHLTAPPSMMLIRRSAEMVYVFDGLYGNVSNVNENRINARHSRQTITNLAFYDGHAASYRTADLPGGLRPNPQGGDFAMPGLAQKYPPPAPLWMLEQQ